MVYDPERLAKRWGCSATSIRNQCQAGQLRHFRLGRLYRIPASVVEEIEGCNSTLDGSAEDTASTGMRTESEGGIVLKHAPERKQRQRP